MGVDQHRQPVADGHQAGGEGQLLAVDEDAVLHGPHLPGGLLQNGKPGAAEGGIDGQNAHGGESMRVDWRFMKDEARGLPGGARAVRVAGSSSGMS